ncbi:hypothetical protein FGIG_06920 [Fasciola gigantica]|uniref:Uncharacterized protein n=1 Tax=Fasciola gigantica TaxID=46835 RepID=A0A504YC71_FASGI|nr:hypothetical protein FGIG_06920 [Fasciola gigantica]
MNKELCVSPRSQLHCEYVNIIDQDHMMTHELLSSPIIDRIPVALITSVLTRAEMARVAQLRWLEQSYEPNRPMKQTDSVLFRLHENRNANESDSEPVEDEGCTNIALGVRVTSNSSDKLADANQSDTPKSIDSQAPAAVVPNTVPGRTNDPAVSAEQNTLIGSEMISDEKLRPSTVGSEIHRAMLENNDILRDESKVVIAHESDLKTNIPELPNPDNESKSERLSGPGNEKCDTDIMPVNEPECQTVLPESFASVVPESQIESRVNESGKSEQQHATGDPDGIPSTENPEKTLTTLSKQKKEQDSHDTPEDQLALLGMKQSQSSCPTMSNFPIQLENRSSLEPKSRTTSSEQNSVLKEPDIPADGQECKMEHKSPGKIVPTQKAQFLTSKISDAARFEMDHLRRVLSNACEDLSHIKESIIRRDFAECVTFYNRVILVPNIMTRIIGKLSYSPFEKDLWQAHDCLTRMLTDVKTKPSQILPRLIELGFYIFEFGDVLGMKVVPRKFASQVHAIQARIHRLSTGRVVRQIIYVPNSFDSVVSTYYKDRRLERVEKFCSCRVQLLSPTHPRAALCPPGFRTLDVNFDPVRGRYIGFHDLLNRCLHPKQRVSRIALTVMRRPDGSEVQLQSGELARLQVIEPRPRLVEVSADLSDKQKHYSYPNQTTVVSDTLFKPADFL